MEGNLEKMGLREFLIDGLEEIYDAEEKFVKCFAALGMVAVNEELKNMLISHSEVTEKHCSRLKQICKQLQCDPGEGNCVIVGCLLDKAAVLIKRVETGSALRDVAIVFLIQTIEHYRIATYGNLASLALEMKYFDIHSLLRQCLADEQETDRFLTRIAKEIINPAANNDFAS